MFWASTVLQDLEASSMLLFHESYALVLLCRRTEKRRKETGDSRALRILVFHPIIPIQAILEGINYGLLHVALASFSFLYVSAYGESISISGLHYISTCTGSISGPQLCGPLMDYVYKRMTCRTDDTHVPELRIPLLLPGVFCTHRLPLSYGWPSQYHFSWLVVDIGVTLLSPMFGMHHATAYVMDACPQHVSSAPAATQVLRSLLVFAFPLFSNTNTLYETLGYGWGNSLLTFLSIGIALPVTGILWRFGTKLRARRQSSY